MVRKASIHKTNFDSKNEEITFNLLEKLKKEKTILDFYFDGDFVMIQGDCIIAMRGLIDNNVKVDHIITDIPYGTIQGLSIEGWKNKGNIPEWDSPLDLGIMLENCFKISKANSNLLLFSQEPMTNKLINFANDYQKYVLSNKMIWLKNNHANGFSSKTTPVNVYEEILLFRKALDESNSIFLRSYFKNILEYTGVKKKDIMQKLGQGLDHCFRYQNRTFYIPTEKNYLSLESNYNINKMRDYLDYSQIKKLWDNENKIIFNHVNESKIIRNVFESKKDKENIHPTQKPQKLLFELINIFSNMNDTILDFTSGSGSTGIAAINSNRKFIGIELDRTFFLKSIEWYKNEKNKQRLF
jgi:site-specific DNA-methyltransferase (adenine-specific)